MSTAGHILYATRRLGTVALRAVLLMLLNLPIAALCQTASVHGIVTDPDGARVPNATISVRPAKGQVRTIVSSGNGEFVFLDLPYGGYALTCWANGFSRYSRVLQVRSQSPETLNISLALQTAVENVEVSDDSNALGISATSTAATRSIKGSDLEALSDDPDQLAAELSALSGPSEGPDGADVYIDGFGGGRLPAKMSIREIRINQEPYSAQYDRLGTGRIEVFTKPGTQAFHGSFQINGNQAALNTGDPLLNAFLSPGQTQRAQPPYYTVLSQGGVLGPVSKHSSFSLYGSDREIRENSLVNAIVPKSLSACESTQSTCNYAAAVPFPQVQFDVTPRIDAQFGGSTVMVRGYYQRSTSDNYGVGNLKLPSTGVHLVKGETLVQASLTNTINSRAVNEVRAEFQKDTIAQAASSTDPTITVPGSFIGGGSPNGSSSDHQIHVEVQDYLALQRGAHFLRLGGRLRITRDANSTTAGSNGMFTYSCLTDVVTSIQANGSVSTSSCPASNSGVVSTFATGQVAQFSLTTRNLPISATLTDLGVYAEDEWRITPRLELAYGIRYEFQNHLSDHRQIGPRLSISYGLGRDANPKTVLRGGFGIFYQRFSLPSIMNTVRQNGTNTVQTIVSYPAINCSPSDLAACGGAATQGNTTYTAARELRSPYLITLGVGLERQITKHISATATVLHQIGVHQFYSENTNAPQNGVYSVPPSAGGSPRISYEYVSGGVARQTWYGLQANARLGRWLSLNGFSYLNYAKSDTGGANSFPSRPRRVGLDYGRALWDIRSKNSLGGSANLPLGFTWSFTLIYYSGTPYNITLGQDLNQDSIYNDRPAFLPGRSNANCKVASDFAIPSSGENYAEVPINYCTGPGAFAMYTRLVKNFGLGRVSEAKATRHGSDSGHRFNLSIGIQVQNLFNNADFGTPQGVITSNSFGRSTQLAGPPFTTQDAVRHVNLLTSFNF